MKITLNEDRRWYVITDEGRLLAGPFDSYTEAVLAEFEIAQKVAMMVIRPRS